MALLHSLPTQAAGRACCALLQENFFFDGPARELNSRRVVLRLRFYDGDKKAVLTLKVCGSEGSGSADTLAGSGRAAGGRCVQYPWGR